MNTEKNMMRKNILKHTFCILLTCLFYNGYSVSLSSLEDSLCNSFYGTEDSDEGLSIFRSLLIPFGGRTESLGLAYTGLCDDISYLQFNPAAASVQKETQISLFHNSPIADAKMETLAFTTRLAKLPDFGLGAYASCFYVPFSEYNMFGEKTASSYYSETTGCFNFSYNFLSGYDFKGLCVGANLKAGWRSVPDYSDNDTNEVIAGSGLEQSGLAFMADAGFLLQFNVLKYYASREPNLRIGFSVKNVGVGFTGFGNEVIQDDSLPSSFNAGVSVRPIKPLVISLEYSQPFDINDFETFHTPYIGSGAAFQFTPSIALLGGFAMKGGNPRISCGVEFEYQKLRMNMNYTLDFTTSAAPINKISLSAKIQLGDKGRSQVEKQVDEYYSQGLVYYSEGDFEKAIKMWEETLKLNKRFDPAILGIKTAKLQTEMFENIQKSMMFE